jgi:type VII secretion integral membrane protein EccD
VTGVRELVELTDGQGISAAADRVRLSIISARTQVDVSLPLDVPIAILLPAMVELVRSREVTDADPSYGAFPKEAKRTIWSLIRVGEETSLLPTTTLRDADIVDGELLRLTSERALSPPTLYDDVVDAAARLNKTGYPSWNAAAARWMAFTGVYLTSATWVYFLVDHALQPNRGSMVGLSVVAALSLVGVAALAHRSYGRTDIGAALGWASIPIGAAVGWATLSGFGGYGLSAGCAAMVVLCGAAFRAIGTGHWGFLAAGVFFGSSAIALAVYALGVPAIIVGATQAVIATLGCLAVPALKARSAHLAPPARKQQDEEASADPFSPPQEGEPEQTHTDTSPAALSVWARVRNAALTRSGVYVGLASSAWVGSSVVLLSTAQVQWPSLAFASVCAATLGLYAQRSATAVERAALVIPAVTLAVLACALARWGRQPMPLLAFTLLLAAIVASSVIAAKSRGDRLSTRSRTALDYMAYLCTGAVIPLALWVVGAYQRLGIT